MIEDHEAEITEDFFQIERERAREREQISLSIVIALSKRVNANGF